MSKPVRITIAESSDIIRWGLNSILKRIHSLNAEILEVAEPAQLKNSLGWQQPDILIINPSFLSHHSLQQIKKESVNPSVRCVAIQTALTDSASMRPYDEILTLYDGTEQIEDKLMRLVSGAGTDKRHEALSQREKEVIAYVVRGMTNKQIADKLCLSTHTVITHRRNISAKLDIHSTAGLTIYAIVNKLFDIDQAMGGGADTTK